MKSILFKTLFILLPILSYGQATLIDKSQISASGATTNQILKWNGTAWVFANDENSGSISGTGTSGQIAFWNGTTSLTGSNNLFWNNTDARLGLGITNPTERLDVVGSIKLSGGLKIPQAAAIEFGTTWNTGTISFNNGPTTAIVFDVPNGRIRNNLGSYLTASSANGRFGTFDNYATTFVTNNVERARIDVNGNLGVGTTSTTGRLTVMGADNSTSTTNALFESLNGTDILKITNAGIITMPTTANAGTDTDRFMVLTSSSEVAQRTGDQVLQDIGVPTYVASRGENLITNGSGLMGNNYNFTGLTFDASNTYYASGSFKTPTTQGSFLNDEFIPVDPNKIYRGTVYAKANPYNANSRTFYGLATYDVDNLIINSQNYMYQANTLTTLAQPLNVGDTIMYLTSATNWNNTSATNSLRSIIFWDYTNSYGYTYPELTYSRNWVDNAYNIGQINYTTNTIRLRVPWAGPVKPAGTKLSNGNSGATYKYFIASSVVVPNDWTQYSGTIGEVDLSGTNVQTKFPPGTAKIKFLQLYNYTSTGSVIWTSNISFGLDNPTGSGTAGYIPKFTTSTNLGNSVIREFTDRIGIGSGAFTARLNVNGQDATDTGWTAQFHNNSGSNNALMIRNDGNVGIGTNTPTSRFDVIGTVEFQNPSTSYDGGVLGTELLTSTGWTTTGWTGTFAGGYTHTTGNTSILSNTLAATVNKFYEVRYTITGRTAGSITINFGGQSTAGQTSTNAFGPKATTTENLQVTPTSDFNGTVVMSVKEITAGTPNIVYKDAGGEVTFEQLVSGTNNNFFQGVSAGKYNTIGTNNIFQGYLAGSENTSGGSNLFQGAYAGEKNTVGSYNTFQGIQAGRSNTTGSYNVFQGPVAGELNTTGSYNVFQGIGAGRNNTSGIANIFQGYNAGLANTTGSYNVAQGYYPLYKVTTGSSNIAVGTFAAGSLTTGSNNIMQGSNSGVSTTTASGNVFIGGEASYGNKVGSYNVSIGYRAGRWVGTGTGTIPDTLLNNSILIGFDARNQAAAQTNQIVIGYEGRGLGSNTTRIGSGSSTNQTHLDGRLTIGNTLYDANVTARISGLSNTASTYALWVTNSDGGTSTAIAPAFVVRNDGNVGIGIKDPVFPLTVTGSAQVTGTVFTPIIRVTNVQDANANTNASIVFGGTNKFIQFNTDNIERMRLFSTGTLGIGTTSPASTSILDITSTTKGILIPRMTLAQRDAITSPATGLQIYNTDSNVFQYYNGTSWTNVGGSSLSGTVNTIPYFNSSTTLASSGMYWDNTNGRLGIGVTSPTKKIDVNDNILVNGVEVGSGLAGATGVNIGIGYNPLASVTSGQLNIGIGYLALNANTTGEANIAIGNQALRYNNANANVAIGSNASQANTTGQNNSIIGLDALRHNTTGSDNVVVGYRAGRYFSTTLTNVTEASGSIFIGSDARPQADSQTNQIVIGFQGRGLGSNSTIIGNTNTTKTYLQGNVGIGSTAFNSRLVVKGEGSTSGTSALRVLNSSDSTILYVQNDRNVGVRTTNPKNALDVNGSFGRGTMVKTTTTSYIVQDNDTYLLFTGSSNVTVTLPAASSWPRREIMIRSYGGDKSVSSGSSNVEFDGTVGTSILPGGTKYALLVSDGTNWVQITRAAN